MVALMSSKVAHWVGVAAARVATVGRFVRVGAVADVIAGRGPSRDVPGTEQRRGVQSVIPAMSTRQVNRSINSQEGRNFDLAIVSLSLPATAVTY